MSKKDLAKQVEVRFQQVQKYENAPNRVSASWLYMTAKDLDIEIEACSGAFDVRF